MISMWDGKKPSTLNPARLEPKNLQTNQSRLGATLLVKGEISGNEDLLIDGSVEGIVQLNEQRLMIGPTANVKADIIAGEVTVRGNLKGSIRAKGQIEIRNDGAVTGDLTTPQVFIEEGALFKGSIEIEKSAEGQSNEDALPETMPAPVKVTADALGATNI
jgi:cytoskeletal protein CcmA (bactofilin family)